MTRTNRVRMDCAEVPETLAGAGGFEPPHGGIKGRIWKFDRSKINQLVGRPLQTPPLSSAPCGTQSRKSPAQTVRMSMEDQHDHVQEKNGQPWNKGKLVGPKPPLRPKHVWSIRTKLQALGRTRDLAIFNLAIDSKLRGCDVVALKVEDVAPHGYALERATVRQQKTGRSVRFELSEQTRQAVEDYLRAANKKPGNFLFSARPGSRRCMSTRQYARLVARWVTMTGLDPTLYGTHSLRRTKATLIYRRTGNLRAVQLLLGHTKIESTVRYLGVEVDDALAIAEQVDV